MKSRMQKSLLFVWLVLGVALFLPSFVTAQPRDELRDSVGPGMCGRFFDNSSLCIGVEIVNTQSSSVSIIGNLTFPEVFVKGVMNRTEVVNSSYLESGIHGVLGNCSFVTGNSSSLSVFRFPVDGSFPESEYYNLELYWKVVDAPFSPSKVSVEYTQRFNVTPFDWIDPETMTPRVVRGIPLPSYDLRITAVILPDTSIYKGDTVIAYVTVHNYGTRSMKAFLNAKVKENSGLYIGFDKGVWAYGGNGVDMIFYVSPGGTYTYSFAFGPVLHDDDRGIWALNGRIDASSYQAVSLWYRLQYVKLRGYGDWAFRTTYTYTCNRDFYVIQDSQTHVIFTAVVDDESCWVDPAAFFEEVVDYSIRIGEGWNLGPYTTFEQEFGVDMQFTSVGEYDWPDSALGHASIYEALRNTAYALGQGLKLGGCWASEKVENPDNPDYSYGYTQRENHGFDIGLGFMPGGFWSHAGEGVAVPLGSIAVAMGAAIPNYVRVKECALHEICHLFGALHGDEYSPPFGPDPPPAGDGYTYVMQNGTGNDLWPWGGWRMHSLTRQIINENNHLKKFDGAPAPEYTSGKWYGQIECYVLMNANAPKDSAYRLDSDGKYHWGYNSQDYTRFSITDDFVYNVEESGRVLCTKHLEAEISYPNPGKASFYVAYKLYWYSTYWPTGFSPSQGMDLDVDYWIWQNSETTASSVDNVRMVVISSRSSSPSQYYFAWFEAASPSTGWFYCHGQWAVQNKMRNIYLTDSTVYLLLGFRDAWSADWEQELQLHPTWIRFTYSWNSW